LHSYASLKQYKQVEETRKLYYNKPSLNSVHCASLLVPEIDGTVVDISFLNHFLLKRNYDKVACRITAIDKNGKKIESRLFQIDKPIVYTIPLTGMVDKPVSNYSVEFFSADNLFIPFPAVMINHRGEGFINQVHSFNRVLNDVFEDDAINAVQVSEASVDLVLSDNTDTFLLFTAGPMQCNESIEIEILTKTNSYKTLCSTNIPRFGTKKYRIKEIFPSIPNGVKGVMKVKQPKQMLFYGRMLTGQITDDGQFSANHSYYDSSVFNEYWEDGSPSQRFYPYFHEIENIIRMYPIMSPSKLFLSVELYNYSGSKIGETMVGDLTSPDNRFLDLTINSVCEKLGLDQKQITTFVLTVKAETNKMPTRVSHQLVYGKGGLNTSINIGLNNPNVFVAKGKKSFKWGQAIVGDQYDSFIGLVGDPSENPCVDGPHETTVKFYDGEGKIAERVWTIPNGGAVTFKVMEELQKELRNSGKTEYVWCTAESDHFGLNFFSACFDKTTNNFSGDHGF